MDDHDMTRLTEEDWFSLEISSLVEPKDLARWRALLGIEQPVRTYWKGRPYEVRRKAK